MKKLMVIVLTGCVFVISQGFREVAADEDETHGIPLSKLAGTFSETVHGSVALCFEHAEPSPLAKCGSTGSIVVPLTILDVGVATRDANGNGCTTLTETEADFPVDVSPPAVFVIHVVSKDKNYDPTTGTSDGSFTSYFGGKCNGATFDSTGATVASTGTYHYAVSNKGKQIDFILTALTNPVDAVGDFSVSGIDLRE